MKKLLTIPETLNMKAGDTIYWRATITSKDPEDTGWDVIFKLAKANGVNAKDLVNEDGYDVRVYTEEVMLNLNTIA